MYLKRALKDQHIYGIFRNAFCCNTYSDSIQENLFVLILHKRKYVISKHISYYYQTGILSAQTEALSSEIALQNGISTEAITVPNLLVHPPNLCGRLCYYPSLPGVTSHLSTKDFKKITQKD